MEQWLLRPARHRRPRRRRQAWGAAPLLPAFHELPI